MKTTYKNKKGNPIIRKCGNCIHFKIINDNTGVNGYCHVMNLYFAFTHEQSVYAIVKDFYVCEKHKLENEDSLKQDAEEIELLPYLLERNFNKK